MKKGEQFLIEQKNLVSQFREAFEEFIQSIANYSPKQRETSIFNYWKEAIKICEDSGQQSNWDGLKLFFEILEISQENQISEQQYQSIKNS